MDYIKLHDKIISHFKQTEPMDRLKSRHKNDTRINEPNLYIESHHIVPKSLGGSDELSNLVDVLPEEHLFIHSLRYKAFNQKEDFLAVRVLLNGFDKQFRYNSIRAILNKRVRSTYAVYKASTAKFRKKHGWQTMDGRRRISEARKTHIQ